MLKDVSSQFSLWVCSKIFDKNLDNSVRNVNVPFEYYITPVLALLDTHPPLVTLCHKFKVLTHPQCVTSHYEFQ